MKILTDHQIRQKISRLAIEIAENNFDEPAIILAGINQNGMAFARLLHEQLSTITRQKITLTSLKISPANPLEGPIEIGMPVEELEGKIIIIVDDVANTGRTIFYACKPLMATLPKRVEVAVLVDRTHKSFPVKVDYVGLSLATTLLEDIDVRIREVDEYSVFLN
ncbi:MAG: phosphoribosyltransferase family protein [Saprospiraceae bacterium]